MSYFLEFGYVPFILAKTAMFMVPIALLEWARRRNPNFVIGTLRCGIALYLVIYTVGVYGINANRQQDQERSHYAALVQKWADMPVSKSADLQRQSNILNMIPRDFE